MTKKVRVENADGSSYKVVVQVWDEGQNGEADKMAFERVLANPSDMADDMFITSTRYLVVKEA